MSSYISSDNDNDSQNKSQLTSEKLVDVIKTDNCILKEIGFDTEYVPGANGSGIKLVSTQIYLHNIHLNRLDRASIKYCVEDVLGVRCLPTGTAFVFDDREIKRQGSSYRGTLEERLAILKEFIGFILPSNGCRVWTFYSNAELSSLFPTTRQLRLKMGLQGDKVYAIGGNRRYTRNHDNLSVSPIHGTLLIRNYKVPGFGTIHFHDARHLYTQSKLADLGNSVGVPNKLDHDFEKENALNWLERDRKSFIEYGVIDAVIPVLAALQLYDCKRKLGKELSQAGVIGDINDKAVNKLVNKENITVPGMAEDYIWLCICNQGKAEMFKNFQKWEIGNLCIKAATAKGGLNKYFYGEPKLFSNHSIYDIKSAYATAMKHIRVPIEKPLVSGYQIYPKARDAKSFWDSDIVEYGKLLVSFELPHDTDEWNRLVVIRDYDKGIGFTGTKFVEQWITLHEFLTICEYHPEVPVTVHQSYWWKKGCESISLYTLISILTELRTGYKNNGDEAMQLTIKLICNAGYGKILQNKECFDSGALHDTILEGGTIRKSTHSNNITSKIHSSIWGNYITGVVRVVLAITARASKAVMCVTDSVICENGKFVSSKDIVTKSKKLNKILGCFEFDCKAEEEGIEFLAFKERDYAAFKVKPEYDPNQVLDELVSGNANSDIVDKFDIVKIAKRGYKSNHHTEPERNRQFFIDSLKRIKGLPLKFIEKKLVKAGEWLTNPDLVLNDVVITEKSIDSHNFRYHCNTEEDLEKCMRIKEVCRRYGYADAKHCELENHELYKKIVSRSSPDRTRKATKTPLQIRRALMVLMSNISSRALEKKLKEGGVQISDSTLHRWYKEFQQSMTHDRVVNGLMESDPRTKMLMCNDPMKIVTEWLEKNNRLSTPPTVVEDYTLSVG